jgi:hypothetical protein
MLEHVKLQLCDKDNVLRLIFRLYFFLQIYGAKIKFYTICTTFLLLSNDKSHGQDTQKTGTDSGTASDNAKTQPFQLFFLDADSVVGEKGEKGEKGLKGGELSVGKCN